MRRRFRLCAGALIAALVIPLTAAATPPRSPSAGLGPRVVHTGTGPTGYTVTFHFRAPTAKSVRIRGEWYFADPYGHAAGLMPAKWRPGYVPLGSPNSTDANWPVTAMKRGAGGVWTYTTPLPSGVFTYGFYVDCAGPQEKGCTQVPDPANGAGAPNSQVYVPSDPRFRTVDYGWQGPSRAPGRLAHLTYDSPGHLDPAGKNRLVVYTPPGYDPHRAAPYPTLYLSHGGGENELGWSTQGDLRNIMDNLIGTGQVRPMVVVMPNASGYPDSADYAAYDTDLLDRVIPYVEAHYRVSGKPSGRAFSGLSLGGAITNSLMLGHTPEFGYYGVMSAGLPCPAPDCTSVTLSAAQAAAVKKVGVYVGGGWQDPVHAAGYQGMDTGTAQEVDSLANAGVAVTPDFVNGGHEWYVWRILLKDFLTRVAFLPSVRG